MTKELLFGLMLGLAMLAGYLALGVYCAKKTWQWAAGIPRRWIRVLLVSGVLVFFFCPGLIAAGHGAGIGPAWLMFASGTFKSMTAPSRLNVMLFILGIWLVTFVVGLLVSREKSSK